MKNIYFGLLLILSGIFCIPVLAESYYPKTISIGSAQILNAGDSVKIDVVDSTESATGMTDIEYGVVQTFTEGYSTSYKIISTESKSLQSISSLNDLSIVIPNMVENSVDNNFVVYVKFFEKNNPDKKKFFFTDRFAIKENNTPFTRIKNINLRHSTGNEFSLLHGPTIYSPEYVAKYTEEENLATSTSLNISFESNQDLTIKPVITFSRLRSDQIEDVIRLDPIQVKKGQTNTVISLPTFNYVPGVYVGKITFNDKSLKSDFNFQYIIGGGSVTIGMVEVVDKNNLKFNVFDTPVDLDRSYQSTSTALVGDSVFMVYGTYVDSTGKVTGNFTQEVNFASTSFTVNIPQKIFSNTKISSVELKVVSKDGVVVFESSKKVNFVQKASVNLFDFIVYAFLIIFLIISLITRSVKLMIVFIILSVIVSLGMYYKINAYANVPAPVSNVRVAGGHGIGKEVVLTTEDDLATKEFICGENIKVNYEFKLNTCNNLPSTGSYNIGFEGKPTVSKNTGRVMLTTMDLGVSTLEYPASMTPPTLVANTSLIVHTHVAGSRPRRYIDVVASSLSYKIPLKNTCGDVQSSCTCVGRNEVCKANGIQTSQTVNSPTCALKASCTVNVSGTSATFNTIVTDAIGVVTYKDVDTGTMITNPYTREVAVGATIVQKTLVTDADGTTATSVCSVTNNTTTNNNSGCPGIDCPNGGTASGTLPGEAPKRKPTIKRFYPEKTIVKKGGTCVYGWEVQDVDRCVLTVNNSDILPLQNNGLQGPVTVSAANGENQRATLTCMAEGLPIQESTISTSTLCQVIPEVIER